MATATELYVATKTLFRAFNYLQPRMQGGSLNPPQAMNAEALAGCILHGCLARLLRDIHDQREQTTQREWPSGWIARPPAVATAK